MTEEEYLAQKASLETQYVANETAYIIDGKFPAYPSWRYHHTQGAVIVQNEAEAIALGRGWSTTPGGPAPTREKTEPAPPVVEPKVEPKGKKA